MRIEIRWKKSTDQGHPRRRVVEIDSPVERETTPLEDAVLALPGSCRGDVWVQSESGHAIPCTACMTPQIEAALDDPPTDEQCIEAIEAALLLARAEVVRLDAEDEESTLANARRYVAGEIIDWDPTYTPNVEIVKKFNVDLAEQIPVETARRTAAEEKRRIARAAHTAAEDAQKEAKSQARAEERLVWIDQHGSERLQRQIEAGLDGWPLYLHEHLVADLPGWELDNDGEDRDVAVNPSESAVLEKLATARHLVELELVTDQKEALEHLTIRTIEFPDEDRDDHYDEDGQVYSCIYLVYDCYRPGRHPSWQSKRVRIAVES